MTRPSLYIYSDHPFDLMERRRVIGKQKEGGISMIGMLSKKVR
jgi:hypothetical protein